MDMKKIFISLIAFTIIIITSCNIPDEEILADTINTVSFNENIAYILEGTSDNPIPNLQLELDYPAASNMIYDLIYSDVNISGPSDATINQGATSVEVNLTGVVAS